MNAESAAGLLLCVIKVMSKLISLSLRVYAYTSTKLLTRCETEEACDEQMMAWLI